MDAEAVTDASVGDAGADGSVGDAGAIELEGAVLLPFPPSLPSAVFRTVAGTASCFEPVLVLRDGRRMELSSRDGTFRVESSDPALFAPTMPGDCTGNMYNREARADLGVLSLGSGAGLVTLHFESGGGTVSAVMSLTALDYRVELSAGEQTVPVGREIEGDFSVSIRDARDESVCLFCENLHGVTLVPRWLRVASLSPAMLSVRTDMGSSFFLGVSRGQAQARWTYAPPDRPVVEVTQSVVVPDGILRTLMSVELEREDGRAFVSSDGVGELIAPGVCARPWARAFYVDPGFAGSGELQYEARVLDMVSWTATGALNLESPLPPRLCALGAGDAAVQGCVGASCVQLALAVHPEGSISGVRMVPTAGAGDPSQCVAGEPMVCPSLRAFADFTDGMSRDITASPAASWVIEDGERGILWRRALSEEGAPLQDPAGNPCFRRSGAWGSDMTISVTYGTVTIGTPPPPMRVPYGPFPGC